MSAVEIGTVLVGLVGGYWLVSVLLDWMAARKNANPWDARASTAQSAPGGGVTSRPTLVDNDNPANWPILLEVSESASSAEINAAYRRKMSEYHPDKVARMGPEIRALAELRSKQINAAYDFAMKLRNRQGG
jgi:DnaJ-domain-containing protein 1